jgi:hypothetical protein
MQSTQESILHLPIGSKAETNDILLSVAALVFILETSIRINYLKLDRALGSCKLT